MNILGIDSSGKCSSVALIKDRKIVGEGFVPQGVTTSQGLLTLIDDILQRTDSSLPELDLIAITKGPGSFTSLRVGVSIVKGLAWADKKPVVGINTLDALAQQSDNYPELVCPILNAHQGQVYAAIYRWQDKKLMKLSDDLLVTPEGLAAGIKEKVLFLGAGVVVCQDQLRSELGDLAEFAPSEINYPNASIIARLGYNQFRLGQVTSALELTPYYIRRPAAEVVWDQKQKSAS